MYPLSLLLQCTITSLLPLLSTLLIVENSFRLAKSEAYLVKAIPRRTIAESRQLRVRARGFEFLIKGELKF